MAINDTKRTILAAAAARTDLHVLPIPESIKVNTATLEKTINQVVGAGLVAEIAAAPDDAVWRHNEEAGRIALVVTHAGLAAIDIDDESMVPPPAPTKRPARGKVGKGAAKPAKAARRATIGPKAGSGGKLSKQDAVISLLRRQQGASVPEMMKATDWQAHSVRGVMSGALKKRLGLEIISEKDEKTGERRYYIAPLKGTK